MTSSSISPSAHIGKGNVFGRGVIVGDEVRIGDNNVFGDYAVITGRTEIGDGNYIGDHISIGRLPTNSNHRYEFLNPVEAAERFGKVVIGDRNVVREFTNVGLPTGDTTSIASDCYIMPHCHIPHDVQIEDRVTLSNHSSPGGHVRILRGANIGKGAQIHQRSVIGQYAMIGMGAVVIRNVLPAVTIAGNPARMIGVNKVGLERNGFAENDIESLATLLTGDSDVDFSNYDLTPALREIADHFLEALSSARDKRTVPPMVS